MPIERYTLGSILRRVRNEFGFDDDPIVNTFIIDRVNDALAHICAFKGNWPWQCREGALDTDEYSAVTLDLTRGSRTATLVSGTLSKRAVLLRDTGYLVTDVTGDTVTLSSAWLGETGEDEVDVGVGYIALPSDCREVATSEQVHTVAGEELKYVDNQRFHHVRRANYSTGQLYTIVPDPLNENTSTWYMAVFPYIEDLTTIHFTYYIVPPELSALEDEPIIPIDNRLVLVHFTLWLVATAKGYDRALMYRDMAYDGLRAMAEKPRSSDLTFEESGGITLDMSGVRNYTLPGNGADYNPAIV